MLLPLDNSIAYATPYKKPFAITIFPAVLLVSLFLCVFLVTPINAGIQEKSVTEEVEVKFESNDLYKALAAEISNTLGEQNIAVDFYYELSANNTDPAIAKRVTELATVTGQIAKALDGAKRWVVLAPNSLEANQYLALLLLRNSRFSLAATQLNTIRNLIEESSIHDETSTFTQSQEYSFKTNESLTFIGAMLTAESHHKKAFDVFNLYLENHASKRDGFAQLYKQKTLIFAQLAMKAKKYEEVVASLENLTGLDAQNHVDAKVMLAKALHKLRNNAAGIQHLKDIQNLPEANDSHRLELVRLLVLDKQKKQALPILKSLVSKHPKNFELLKSFIALQIDLSILNDVAAQIKLLRSNEGYINEASYFSGEFAEKLGQVEKALLNYSNVNSGKYLKNAHKKIISLIKKTEETEALNVFFDNKQKNADSIKNQAYWFKLQADDLFESHQYTSALDLYNKAIRLTPNRNRYRYKRGLVFERIGNIKAAEADFNHVLKKRHNHYEVLNALGYMLSVHTDRLSEAKTYIEKAYQLKPNDPLVLDSLGYVLYKSGELNKAEKYLRKAFNLTKKPEVASHLISVLAKLNQHAEAKVIYQEMRRIYPNSPSLKSVAKQFP